MSSPFLIRFLRGAIPTRLIDTLGRQQIELLLFPISEPTLSEITTLFDEVDNWLGTGPTEPVRNTSRLGSTLDLMGTASPRRSWQWSHMRTSTGT